MCYNDVERLSFIIVLLVAGTLAACSGSGMVPEPAENRTVVYDPDEPNFDMEAVAAVRDGRTGFDVYSAIPKSSLVFVAEGTRHRAAYELLVRVLPRGDDRLVKEEAWRDSIFADNFEETQSFDRLMRTDYVPLAPGAYQIELHLEDLQSGVRAERRQELRIPDVGSGETVVSDVRLIMSRDGGPFAPAVPIHLPSAYDSLRAVADLYNLTAEAAAQLTLVRFPADTSVARPPFFFTPGHFSLGYMGVDYERGDTLQVSQRQLQGDVDHVSIEFSLPALDKGVYAAELKMAGEGFERVSRRHFVVMRPNFPSISSLEEMVAALQYIARESEWKEIAEADSPEEQRRRFDAFWAELVPNREAAASLLQAYYSRVEEANILYSNHKEGWKTDFGMIYIVFGPPSYTESLHVRDVWYYFEPGTALSRRLPPFVFRRSTTYGFAGLFEHYVLERDAAHEYEWRRRIEKWRDGVAM